MKIDIFTLCDNAQEYGGKLVVVGTFNEIYAEKFPATHPEMAIVARIIIEDDDLEIHDLEIFAVNAETGKPALISPFKTRLDTKEHKGRTLYSNIILRMNNIFLQEPGKYIIKFRIDEMERETVLMVRNLSEQKLQ